MTGGSPHEHIDLLEGRIDQVECTIASIYDVLETFLVKRARLDGQQSVSDDLLARVRTSKARFLGGEG
jgi:hypothetical protein